MIIESIEGVGWEHAHLARGGALHGRLPVRGHVVWRGDSVLGNDAISQRTRMDSLVVPVWLGVVRVSLYVLNAARIVVTALPSEYFLVGAIAISSVLASELRGCFVVIFGLEAWSGWHLSAIAPDEASESLHILELLLFASLGSVLADADVICGAALLVNVFIAIYAFRAKSSQSVHASCYTWSLLLFLTHLLLLLLEGTPLVLAWVRQWLHMRHRHSFIAVHRSCLLPFLLLRLLARWQVHRGMNLSAIFLDGGVRCVH